MRKTLMLRSIIWATVALAVLFQVAVLFELHSPLPSAPALWCLSVPSIACVAVALGAQRSLTAVAKITYAPDKVWPQGRVNVEEDYRIPASYCVILSRQSSFPVHYPRTQCFYLNDGSADRAVWTASMENPGWRVIGVEPPNLSTRMPQSDRSCRPSHAWHVA